MAGQNAIVVGCDIITGVLQIVVNKRSSCTVTTTTSYASTSVPLASYKRLCSRAPILTLLGPRLIQATVYSLCKRCMLYPINQWFEFSGRPSVRCVLAIPMFDRFLVGVSRRSL